MSLNKLVRDAVLLTALASVTPNAGCNKTNQGTPDGQPTHDGRISGPWGSSAESWDCVRDQLNDRDCRAVREERRRRIAEIPSLFECVDGTTKFKARPSQLADLGDFSRAEAQTKGDCSEETREARMRIRRVLDRMACDKEGKPHEELDFGDAEGGRIYNPCADGKC